MDESKNKIAIISASLGRGGAERFAGLLGCLLENSGYEIHNIIINDRVDYQYCGVLCNLGKATKEENIFSRKFQKGKLLKRYLHENGIGTIIDSRSRNHFIREFLAQRIFGKRKKIAIIHSYNLKNYLPKSIFLAQLLYKNTQLVCVSKAIEKEVRSKYGFENITTIYNPVGIPEISSNAIVTEGKFILFFGRLEEKVKNFRLMIESFANSKAVKLGYKLVIMGSGPDEKEIKSFISDFKMEDDISIIPFEENPFAYVKKARFTILTSHYEGFPMSIIESLACGTPVVSVDCKSGPNEIIQNRHNGLLVPNHNSKALSEAINQFVEDDNLYDICKQNAVKSVAHLSPETISAQWQQILSQK